MEASTALTIIYIVICAALLIVGYYYYFRDKSLSDIRADVYQLFLKAERNPEFVHKGKAKMRWVLAQVKSLLPKWLQPFIKDEVLEDIVQVWFDSIKDLLDDGKINGTAETEEE